MTEHKGACCSSPAAMCYWLAASLIAWGVLSLASAPSAIRSNDTFRNGNRLRCELA